jgi:NAD(P)-dependent dehydrogenase (short-subunit alcohol dehydrogenase family)
MSAREGRAITGLLGGGQGKAKFWKVDVSDSNAVRKVMDAVETHFGRIDILINSAGVDVGKSYAEGSQLRQWGRAMQLNVNGSRYASQNIRVHCIQPSVIRPPALAAMLRKQGDLSQALADRAEVELRVGRGSATDVAAAILYLVSDASRFVSGSELVIDAGSR